MHNTIASPNLTLNVIDCMLPFVNHFFPPAVVRRRDSHEELKSIVGIRSSSSPVLRMHHQALKMKDGWSIKAIPKCQASAMAASVAETKRLRRRRRYVGVHHPSRLADRESAPTANFFSLSLRPESRCVHLRAHLPGSAYTAAIPRSQ